ncbi:MAG: hypothetical protein FWC27_08355 [Firmicutes bacterium]|nr:hypothetical protein [Bacillota bacterium]
MNFNISFNLFEVLRQLMNVRGSISGMADVVRQFWASVRDILRALGL